MHLFILLIRSILIKYSVHIMNVVSSIILCIWVHIGSGIVCQGIFYMVAKSNIVSYSI